MSSDEARSDPRRKVQREVAKARAAVMGGHGPDTSPQEVLEQTRGKTVQAGIPVVRRLAQTARDAARARSGDPEFIDGGLAINERTAP